MKHDGVSKSEGLLLIAMLARDFLDALSSTLESSSVEASLSLFLLLEGHLLLFLLLLLFLALLLIILIVTIVGQFATT